MILRTKKRRKHGPKANCLVQIVKNHVENERDGETTEFFSNT